MKKLICLLMVIFLSLTLSSCSLIIDILEYYLGEESKYEYPNYDYDNIKSVSDLYIGHMPSVGNVHTLVLLVEFPDELHAKQHTKEYMEEVFFGDGKEFESVASFYEKSSYGNLSITGDVYGWYKTTKRSSSYELRHGSYASDVILKEAIEYYVDNDLIDLSNYDSDNDGFVDAISVIDSKKYKESSNTWWAYQTPYMYNVEELGYLEYGNMRISNYLFASAHFLENTNDTTTFIHETAHLMGLDDYYDYAPQLFNQNGLGGADMMDENIGDHCSISKIVLDWVEPIIVDITANKTYTINSFTKTGNVLLIPKENYSGIFDEYYLIELYDPSGLNSTSPFFTKLGVRILHVDASLGEGGMDGDYFTYFNCDNTDTKNPFVDMVSKRKTIFDTMANNDDLFYANDIFSNIKWYDGDSSDIQILIKNIDENKLNATIEIIIE